MRGRGGWARTVVGTATALLVACGGPRPVVEDDPSPSPTTSTVDGTPRTDGAPDVTAIVEATDACRDLHQLAVALVTRDADRARAELPDLAGIDALIDALLDEDVPDAVFGSALGLQPARPYGGVAGAAVEQRYADLGCTPDDEYPVLRSWFDLPPSDDPDAGLEDAVAQRMEGEGAGGFGMLGLARRLLEGSPTSGDAAVMVATLRAAVDAQERHRARTGTYADTEQVLVDHGLPDEALDVDGDAWLLVWAADEDAYCMSVGGQRGSAHVESHDAEPVVEPRPNPCLHTFRDEFAPPDASPTPAG